MHRVKPVDQMVYQLNTFCNTVYARPSLVVHLKLLFNLLLLQGFIPGGFDAGVIVPGSYKGQMMQFKLHS